MKDTMSQDPFTEPKRRVAVITGGTAGLGRATAREFADRGYAVAVLARGEDRLDATRREIESMGVPVLALKVDVADAAAVEAAADEIETKLGPIDVWVNNAMTSVFAPVEAIEPEEFRRVMDVCFHGFVHGTLAALKRMKPRDRGVIVQTGSALAYRGIPLQAAYCAAKHAIQGFHDSLRSELLSEKSGVQVTMVQMPALNTPQFEWVRSRLPRKSQPVPPIFEPEVAARALVRAAEHPRREYLVGFSSFKAVWGNKFFPGLGDRYLARTGFEGQQTGEPDDHLRPDNLFKPYPGADIGAHGSFSSRARDQETLLDNRPLLVSVLSAAGLVAVGAFSYWAVKGSGGGRKTQLNASRSLRKSSALLRSVRAAPQRGGLPRLSRLF